MKPEASVKLFFIPAIVLLFLFLISLPGLASPSADKQPEISATYTPTLNQQLSEPENTPLRTISPSISIVQTIVVTDTLIPTPTYSISPTFTLAPTITPTITLTPRTTQFSYLPDTYREHINPTYTPTPTVPPPQTVLFCDDLSYPISIPDNDANGVNGDILISDGRVLVNVRLYIDISHSYVGDLVVTLSNLEANQTITAINQPGSPPYGCGNSDIVAILGDDAILPADDKCATY